MWRNSPILGGMVAALARSVLSTVEWGWKSELGDDDPRIEFLERAEHRMKPDWKNHVAEAIEPTLVFGYTPFATWLERVNGEILWRKLLMIGQNTVWRWYFDEDEEISGLQQLAIGFPVEDIPIERIVLYRTSVYRGNPEGRSVFRNCWIPYYFAKNMMQIEGVGVERDIAGTPKVKLPQNADTAANSADMQRAEQIARNLRNDDQAGVVEPFGWLVELLASPGSRLFDTDKIITRYESRMLMSAGAQFLMLGQNGVGSLALSRDQTDFFVMFANGVAEMVANCFTEYGVKPLLKLNGYDPEGITRTHTPAGDIDLEKLGNFLSSIGDKITWTTRDQVWLRQTSELPDLTEEEIEAAKMERQNKALEIAGAQGSAAQAQQVISQPPADPDNKQPVPPNGNKPPDVAKMRADLYALIKRVEKSMDNA